MEFDENQYPDHNPADAVEIYSTQAVLGFSILADPLIGGILLIINLWVVGYKRAIWTVVGFLIAFEALLSSAEYWFSNSYDLKYQQNALCYLGMVKGLQVAGGFVLTQYFYKKTFPEKDYYPKNVLIPLGITLVVLFTMSHYGFMF